ncbi:MAG: hypothetical protein ACUVQ4_01775 [bacterium]
MMANLLLIYYIFNTDSLDLKTDTLKKDISSSYEMGYHDGKIQASRAQYAGYCMGGFAAGLGGGCIFSLIYNEGFKNSIDDVNELAAASVVGSGITGVAFYVGGQRIDNVPRNITSRDSLYIAGYLDGYRNATRTRRTIDYIGGWVIGSAISVGVIYFIVGVLTGLGM